MKNLFVFLLLSIAIAPLAQQQDELEPFNIDKAGIAIKGIDVVSYFVNKKPIAGDKKFSYKWQEVTWYFATAENKAAFIKEPQKYAPQYGGHCAWAASRGYVYDADPQVWEIVKDKLYLNYNQEVQKMWQKETTKNIVLGDKNWPQLAKELNKKRAQQRQQQQK